MAEALSRTLSDAYRRVISVIRQSQDRAGAAREFREFLNVTPSTPGLNEKIQRARSILAKLRRRSVSGIKRSSAGLHTIGAKCLFSDFANLTSLSLADIGRHRVRADHKDNGVGLCNKALDGLPTLA